MKKIYIASPYRIGDPARNVRRSLDAADILIGHGMAPYAPLLNHFQHMIHARTEETWLELDIVWLEACDAVLRLSGDSAGADNEVAHAKARGIPVFTTYQELLRWAT